MYMGFPEEGDICPKCGDKSGLKYQEPDDCSCHISPPCPSCTDIRLYCEACDWIDESEEFQTIEAAPGLGIREYRPRPLDKSKISYRIKPHTSFSQVLEGVYPDGASIEDVKREVKSYFGGRFVHFGGGKFKYIQYTD